MRAGPLGKWAAAVRAWGGLRAAFSRSPPAVPVLRAHQVLSRRGLEAGPSPSLSSSFSPASGSFLPAQSSAVASSYALVQGLLWTRTVSPGALVAMHGPAPALVHFGFQLWVVRLSAPPLAPLDSGPKGRRACVSITSLPSAGPAPEAETSTGRSRETGPALEVLRDQVSGLLRSVGR